MMLWRHSPDVHSRVSQDSDPEGAIDLRGYVVVKALDCDGAGTHRFAFKLVKYAASVDRHYFRCRTEEEMTR